MDPMTIAAIAKGASQIGGGIMDYLGNKAKMDAYRAAANAKIDADKQTQTTGDAYYDSIIKALSPEAATYTSDLASLRAANQATPLTMGAFDTSKYNVQNYLDPSMAWQQAQAAKAIDQSAAARGGMFSGTGATAKALQDRATQLAQTDWGNAFSRMSSDRATNYGMFKDKFEADKQAEIDRINRLGSNATQSGTARSNMWDSQGGKTNFDISTTKDIADLIAGKKSAEGDFYKSTYDTFGNGIRSLGDTASSAIASKSGGIGNLSQNAGGFDFSKMSSSNKMALLTQLLSNK